MGPEQPEKLPQKPPSPRERPHPRSAEGPTTTPATPTGEPRERPHLRSAEGPKQPKKLPGEDYRPPNVCTLVTTIRKLLQYSNELKKVVSILARIIATQAARDRHAIETAPSTKYLWLANQMLFIIESHDVGNEVQKKMTTLALRV